MINITVGQSNVMPLSSVIYLSSCLCQRAHHCQLQHLQMTDPDDRRSRSRSHSQTPPETPQGPFPQPNFVAANPAHISSLGLGVPQLRFPILTSVHQQNSVSGRPVVD